jgi:hypothetical protein
MKTSHQIRQWAAEWALHRSLASEAPAFEFPPSADIEDEPANPYTVSTGFDVPGMLLDQLRQSIEPDLATEARQKSLYTVATGNQDLPADLLKEGQIVQLRPGVLPQCERPVYILIEKCDPVKRQVLATPFSPLTIPALPSELETGIDDEALTVLALWNSQCLPVERVGKCWEVMEATPDLMAEVATVRASLARKESPPLALLPRTGPPLTDPDDPRHEYLAAEEQIWAQD